MASVGPAREPQRFTGEAWVTGVAGQAGALLHHVDVQMCALLTDLGGVDQQCRFLMETTGEFLVVGVVGAPRALDAKIRRDHEQLPADCRRVVALVEHPAGMDKMPQHLREHRTAPDCGVLGAQPDEGRLQVAHMRAVHPIRDWHHRQGGEPADQCAELASA